jgi:hypothetical protein
MSPDTTVDIIVVGGGLAGLSITYQLTRLGVNPLPKSQALKPLIELAISCRFSKENLY